MAGDRFAFRRPRQCPNCGPDAASSIVIGQTLKGRLVHIEWQCGLCGVHWPIEPTDQGDRRVGERRRVERKRLPTKDRRKG